jgi:eukaryotic-like serine/threonine-protein kinase
MSAISNDDLLAELLNRFTAKLRIGERPDIEQAIRQHPELATELRELWGAVMVADAVAAHSSMTFAIPRGGENSKATNSHSVRQPINSPIALPSLLGDYELLEELGRGGMGVVYKARQLSLGRSVALKMILRGALASPADLARFQAEAEAVARLDHPNIVPLYEVGQLEGQPYFSMKFVAGTTLARKLAEGPLPPREAAEMLAPICRAIHFAHRQGLLHRDLKPSNILLDEDGRPLVTDFGLAKRFTDGTSLTHTGAVVGTPSYMAPEQAAGGRGDIGPASDVYSLGTILYQMLTGRPPFQAASPVDTVLMVLEQDPLPPRVVNAKADRDLEMIALKAIQKPPDLRYHTTEAMAEDLEAYLAGEPVSARSGGLTQVIARLFRETHHATVLQNWGLLWMWHSAVLLLLCTVTNWLKWRDVNSRWPYLALWAGGLIVWAPIFWAIRRRAGPVTFVERQIAHVWGAAVAASISLFIVEMLLGLPVLTLSPVLGLVNGMVFVVKAGILTGTFYVQAAALFITAGLMCVFPSVGLLIFGIVSALCFFVPGLKYYREARST